MTPENERRWTEYWSASSGTYSSRVASDISFYERISEYLSDLGILSGGRSVLDVGCGPGTFAIPFSKRCGSVTGLDSSKGMLDRLAAGSLERGLENISTCHATWEDYDGGSYDMVFSSLSPAVRDHRTLMKMEDHSKEYCCYVTARGCTAGMHRNELWQKIYGKKLENSGAYDVVYPLNILLEEGRSPDLRFFRNEADHVSRTEDMVSEYTEYFSIFGEMTEDIRERIKDHFQDVDENGVCYDRYTTDLAVLSWRKGADE